MSGGLLAALRDHLVDHLNGLAALAGRRHLDLPLAKDATGRLLVWIIGLMVLLALLALGATLVLSRQAQRWQAGATGALTVQVSPAPSAGAGVPVAPLARRVETALAILRNSPLVASAEPVAAEQVAALLSPWLAESAMAELPVPALIDVRLAAAPQPKRAPTAPTETAGDLDTLAEHLERYVPGARLERHTTWLEDLVRLAQVTEAAALTVLLVVAGVGVLAVVFAVHSGLAIHRELVELLHVMGATDQYISGQFESHVLAIAGRGAGVGSLAGAMVLAGLERAVTGFGGSLMPELSLAAVDWLTLTLVPLLACLAAVGTARWTVRRTLARLA